MQTLDCSSVFMFGCHNFDVHPALRPPPSFPPHPLSALQLFLSNVKLINMKAKHFNILTTKRTLIFSCVCNALNIFTNICTYTSKEQEIHQIIVHLWFSYVKAWLLEIHKFQKGDNNSHLSKTNQYNVY